MTHEILRNDDLTSDIDKRLVRLANRLAFATAESTPYPLRTMLAAVNTYREGLAGNLGTEAAERLAGLALENLVDPLELEQPSFWGTPLGRACAWWVGGSPHVASVGRMTAAAALGCSRQNVAEMVARGTLTGSGTGIARESLRDLMRVRYPRGT